MSINPFTAAAASTGSVAVNDTSITCEPVIGRTTVARCTPSSTSFRMERGGGPDVVSAAGGS